MSGAARKFQHELNDPTPKSRDAWTSEPTGGLAGPIGWELEHDDTAPSRPSPAARTQRAFDPAQLRTLMSEKQLMTHGLRVFDHAARSWLIPLDADMLEDERPAANWYEGLADRIDELRAIAAEEELPFIESSAREALTFAKELNATSRPGAFLVGNGCVRLLWAADPEQIGLQFKGDGTIQYVLFVQRAGQVATHMGGDNKETILRQVTAVGLRHLFEA